MTIKPLFKVLSLLVLLILVGVQGAFAEDNRINQVHHFGGDALFCDSEVGCYLLNAAGEQLWDVSQAAIDAAMATACETGTSQFIDAGIGTYGPNTLIIHCYAGMEPGLTLNGYDEWGKLNEMQFSPTYEPVNSPVEHEEIIVPTPKPVIKSCSASLLGVSSISSPVYC